ncbi:MAG TPA: IS1595 family transposase [Terriglobia bacterium]|nr:IS1595 family transposase [Terriglobia bacterium]
MNLIELAKNFSTEEAAIAYLEEKLWPKGPVCPHCGVIGEAFKMQSKAGTKAANKMRPGLWKCSGCRKSFRVTMGTIFEDSHIPLHKWMMAIHLMSASKKGISAHQMHRMLGLGYRAAWFMAHRIRHAMDEKMTSKLSGTVEEDESWVGPRKEKGVMGTPNVFRSKKTPVVALVERNGRVRSMPVEHVTSKALKPLFKKYVSEHAVINTDENKVYSFVVDKYAGHDVVNHQKEEYSRRTVLGRLATTNTVEGFFSLIKRGVYGTFHHISRQHLHRYLNEFDFRYNARDTTDGERAELAIKSVVAKRLMYRDSCAKA